MRTENVFCFVLKRQFWQSVKTLQVVSSYLPTLPASPTDTQFFEHWGLPCHNEICFEKLSPCSNITSLSLTRTHIHSIQIHVFIFLFTCKKGVITSFIPTPLHLWVSYSPFGICTQSGSFSLKLVITLTAASLSTAVSLIRKQRWEYSVSSYNHIYMKGKLEWKRGILCSTSSAAQPCKRISIIQLSMHPRHPSSPLCNPHGRPTDRQDTTSSAISHPQKLQQWEKERAGSCL